MKAVSFLQHNYFRLVGKYLLLPIGVILFLAISILGVSIFSLDYVKSDGLMPVDNKTTIVIENVHIVNTSTTQLNSTSSDSPILNNRQVIIENGVITAINAASSPVDKNQDNIKVIDGKGGYLSPGLFDMHVHLYDRKYLTLNLAYGVTSVRNLNGNMNHLRWKEELQNEEWLGSNVYLSSPILAGKGTHALSQEILTPEQGRSEVQKAKESGYDLIKMYGYLDASIFEAIVDEARTVGIEIAKHGPHPAKGSTWDYIEGMQTLEHVEDVFQGSLNYEFDLDAIKPVVAQLKESNVPVVPTLETFAHLTQLSNQKQSFVNTLALDYINPLHFDIETSFSVERWLNDSAKNSAYHLKKQQFLLDIVREMHQQNVSILVGSDAGTMYTLPGIATHNEMALLHRAGLSNHDVIKAATINAAKAMNIDNQYGSVEINKIADLILSAQNPLETLDALKSPTAVVKNGQWISESQLDQMKANAKITDNYYWSFVGFIADLLHRNVFY